MRWAPVNKQLSVSDTDEILILLDEATVPTVTIISIRTTKDVLLFFGPTSEPLSAANSLLLLSGEGYAESGIMVSGEIRFRNAVPGELPLVRGIVWGR